MMGGQGPVNSRSEKDPQLESIPSAAVVKATFSSSINVFIESFNPYKCSAPGKEALPQRPWHHLSVALHAKWGNMDRLLSQQKQQARERPRCASLHDANLHRNSPQMKI